MRTIEAGCVHLIQGLARSFAQRVGVRRTARSGSVMTRYDTHHCTRLGISTSPDRRLSEAGRR